MSAKPQCPSLTEKHSQRRLDVAVLHQALLDLKLPTNAFRVKIAQNKERIHVMLDAARWFFANTHPNHVLSLQQICERLGVNARKLARCVFKALSAQRQEEIRVGLKHYQPGLP